MPLPAPLLILQDSLVRLVGWAVLPILMGLQEADVSGTAIHFFREGFVHIIPEGLDHILFVLGLFLICREFSMLLVQIALFTVGHSLTFGLGMLGVVQVPERPVEVLIALSIAFVAVENVISARPRRWRNLSVFVFGLVHGFGFANAFQGMEVSPVLLPVALLSLNFGVGMGHLAVVAAAYLILSAFWSRAWYRPAVAIPASGAIAIVSLCWAVMRLTA